MTAQDNEQAPKREARKVWPIRVAPSGIALFTRRAKEQGYDAPTAWARDVLAAEAMNPLHKPTPRETRNP